MRTRVGYAGGTSSDPTYHDLGDHTEAFEVDFDPRVISYAELLDLFWSSHRPGRRVNYTQYKPMVLCRGAEQLRMARASRDEVARALGTEVFTEVVELTRFHRAEDYHQKYRLRHSAEWYERVRRLHRDERAFIDSFEAARLNGLAGGHGDRERVLAEVGFASSAAG